VTAPAAPAAPAGAHLLVSLGNGPGPLRCVLLHPAGGGVTAYLRIAGHLAGWGPVAAIRAAGLLPGERPHGDVGAMVEAYAPLLASPPRPNLLLGWSMGGVLAWELAARLAASGPAPAVIMIDSAVRADAALAGGLGELRRRLLEHAASGLGTQPGGEVAATVDAHLRACARHRVTARLSAPALLLACGDEEVTERLGDWGALGEQLRIQRLPGEHFEVFSPAVLPLLLGHVDSFITTALATEVAR